MPKVSVCCKKNADIVCEYDEQIKVQNSPSSLFGAGKAPAGILYRVLGIHFKQKVGQRRQTKPIINLKITTILKGNIERPGLPQAKSKA